LVLDRVSFDVAPGTICAIVAPSGDGKTTLLRLVAGVYPPQQGAVEVLGLQPHRLPPARRGRVGYMPQHFVLYPELSARQNLEFVAGIYGIPRHECANRIARCLERVELVEARDRKAGRLSGGMQRRLQLAASLLSEPEVLVMDEPTAGIDPVLRGRFWDYFRVLRAAGRTLIFSTQQLEEAEHGDQVVLLREGRLVARGAPAELRARARRARDGAAASCRAFDEVFRLLLERGTEGDE
jgi:ABC-2 type transport system ATP-binding protein